MIQISFILVLISLGTSLSVPKTLVSTDASSSSTPRTKASLHLPHNTKASSPSTAMPKTSIHLPHRDSTEASSPSTAKPKTSIHLPLKHLSTQNYFDRPKTFNPHLTYPERYKGVAFVALIHFGSPTVPQYLHVDTGSTLTWINCFPCANCVWEFIYPRYHPQDSSTYYPAGYCESTPSHTNPQFTYSYQSRKCTYVQSYADKSVIKGTLSRERLLMKTLDGGFDTLQGVYFGCNDQAIGNSYTGNGILGLGSGEYSLVERLGSRFSLCFGRMREPTDNHSLVLGEGAILDGTRTRINVTGGHSIFVVDTISVGQEFLDCSPTQVYVDTGTALTQLSKPMYEFIEREVKDAMRRFTLVKYGSLLCYRVEVQEIPEVIDIGFEFAGGAAISVEARNLFLPNGNHGTLCLGIKRSTDNYNIIGAISLQGYNFGYNLKQNTVHIVERKC